MKVKCPKCGYSEDVESCQVGDIVQCPCGHEYAAGVVTVNVNLFSDEQANIACPYCGQPLVIPKEAVDRNVRCSECEGRFRIALNIDESLQGSVGNVTSSDKESVSPQMEDVVMTGKMMSGQFGRVADELGKSQHKFKLPSRKASKQASIVTLALGVLFLCHTLANRGCLLTWVDDDVCVAKYTKALTQKDYDKARAWAKRIQNRNMRSEALEIIDETENVLRKMPGKLKKKMQTYH